MEGPLCDILWADPMNEDDRHKLTDDEYRQFLDTDYVANQVDRRIVYLARCDVRMMTKSQRQMPSIRRL